jgi:Protein of unknown function (DUF3662)/FHA domain
MGLQGFERRMERTVEDVFARAFKSKIKPIELGRRLIKDMDANRTLDVRGRSVVPNAFTFALSPEDHAPFVEIHDALVRELVDAAHHHAADEKYSFMGPVLIDVIADAELKSGRFTCASRMIDGASLPVKGVAVLTDGRRIEIGAAPAVIGRLPDCEIPLTDPNISRRHAEIRTVDGAHQITDLGSTNGTRVNGVPVGYHRLAAGDVITLGSTTIRYEAS